MPRVLYIVYWGALEPLGKSLVIPTLKRLSQSGVEYTLLTFEKPEDLVKTDEMAEMRQMLEEHSIEWIHLQYHKTPKAPATLFDLINGIVRGLVKRLDKKIDIVHCRTFTVALIGMVLAPLINAKFVYHNEGFYPDEQVDFGTWGENSHPHKVTRYLDKRMFAKADGIIVLSHQAKNILAKLPAVAENKTPIIVVPSCVDLDHFKLPETPVKVKNDEIRFVYAGSIGGRYILDKIGSFISAVKQINPNVKLQIFSKTDPELVNKMLSEGGLSPNDWQLEAVRYEDIPKRLAEHHVGIHFLQKGISEHTGSPTKIGEYWAVGLPVVITPNMSDNDEIIQQENVGVVIKDQTDEFYLEGFEKLQKLLTDNQLSLRCRQTAENHCAVVSACEKQLALYKQLVKN